MGGLGDATGNLYGLLLLYAFLIGVGLGVLWDAFRLLKMATLHSFPSQKKLQTSIPLPKTTREAALVLQKKAENRPSGIVALSYIAFCDILFFLLAAIAVILLLFQLNFGEVRAFVPLFTLGGFFLYRHTASRPIMRLASIVLYGLHIAMQWLYRHTLAQLLHLLRKATLSLRMALHLRKAKRYTKRYTRRLTKEMERDFR